jgi:hypothetical protein
MRFRHLRGMGLSKLLNPRPIIHPSVSSIAIAVRSHLSSVLSATLGSGIALTLVPAVQAATLINNAGIQFEQDTSLETNFVESHGAYRSTFGVINLDTKEKTPLLIETRSSDSPESIFRPSSKINHLGAPGDFTGTPGKVLQKTAANYNFKAGNRYVFYLESTYNDRPTGILYSTDAFNPNQEQQAQFAGAPTELCTAGMKIAWDDTGSRLVRNRQQQDRDFDDFVVDLRQSVCAIGGGEKPPVADLPPAPVAVAPIPVVGARRGGAEWGLLALPFLAFLGGGDSDGGGGGGGTFVSDISMNNPPGGLPGGLPGNPETPPTESVPEPMTILGSGIAIGFGGLFQRRRNQQKKKRDRES